MVQRIVPIELGYSHESPGRFRGLLQLPLVAMLLLPSVVFRVMGEVAEFAYETPLVGNRQSWWLRRGLSSAYRRICSPAIDYSEVEALSLRAGSATDRRLNRAEVT